MLCDASIRKLAQLSTAVTMDHFHFLPILFSNKSINPFVYKISINQLIIEALQFSFHLEYLPKLNP